jgi:putative restriction endonuclease
MRQFVGGKCLIQCTRYCDRADTLEAAHISPYRGNHINDVRNGMLLRADIRTFFDIRRIDFALSSHKVIIYESLAGTVHVM